MSEMSDLHSFTIHFFPLLFYTTFNMRYGIFSDIHGHYDRLLKVISFLEDHLIGKYICLGDIVCHGERPNDCIERFRAKKCITVQGNYDFACSAANDLSDYTQGEQEAILVTREELTSENKNYLANLPLTYSDELILAVHASPNSWENDGGGLYSSGVHAPLLPRKPREEIESAEFPEES
jgi:hypothetical protein